jgi:hypothetical protein
LAQIEGLLLLNLGDGRAPVEVSEAAPA